MMVIYTSVLECSIPRSSIKVIEIWQSKDFDQHLGMLSFAIVIQYFHKFHISRQPSSPNALVKSLLYQLCWYGSEIIWQFKIGLYCLKTMRSKWLRQFAHNHRASNSASGCATPRNPLKIKSSDSPLSKENIPKCIKEKLKKIYSGSAPNCGLFQKIKTSDEELSESSLHDHHTTPINFVVF